MKICTLTNCETDSKSKFLYLIPAGGTDRYCYWAETCQSSIRNIGRYNGDTLIATDRPDFFTFDNDKTKTKPIDMENTPQCNGSFFMYLKYLALTDYADDNCNINDYDYIITSDADILWVNNINPLLDFTVKNLKNKIGYFREDISQDRGWYSTGLKMDKDTFGLSQQGKGGITSGFYICCTSVYKKYMTRWKELTNHLSKTNSKIRDQHPFNCLIETGEFDAVELPSEYYGIPEYYLKQNMLDRHKEKINANNILHHIVGTSDINVHRRMKPYYFDLLKENNLPTEPYLYHPPVSYSSN